MHPMDQIMNDQTKLDPRPNLEVYPNVFPVLLEGWIVGPPSTPDFSFLKFP